MQNRSRAWISLAPVALIAAVGAGGLALLPAPAPAPAPATQAEALAPFKVDSVHSFVVFRIKHLGVANAYGMIHEPTGSFAIDPANPGASTIEVSVPSAKVSTGSNGRDAHIRRDDFFNAGEFPNITFKSSGFTPVSDGVFDVAGNLTFLGVTKPVTARLTVLGTGSSRGKDLMGVEATFTIKRSEFGNTTYIKEGSLSDDVHLIVALEGTR